MEQFTHEEIEEHILDLDLTIYSSQLVAAKEKMCKLSNIATYLLAEGRADKRYIQRLEKLNNTLLGKAHDEL